jgi:hemerythrin-like domain-containing protein
MATDAADMFLVHRVFRREFEDFPRLIADVRAGDVARAKVVGAHLHFMIDALHHHHKSEDELAWAVLKTRVPDRRNDIERMESQHGGIDDAVNRVQSDLSVWTTVVDEPTRDRLLGSVSDLSRQLVQHLDDEERNAVPIIEEHLTHDEWKAAIKRGSAFLNTHPRLGIVLGGLVLDYATPDERPKFLSGVPLPARLMVMLLGPRMTASYRRRLHATSG